MLEACEPVIRKNSFMEGGITVVILIPFFFWLCRYVSLDFWFDEVFTLKHFVFVPLTQTVTDYSYPNNHIFFNLISNVYLRLIGVRDIYSLMECPGAIRLLPLLYTMVTSAYVYLIGRRFFNKSVANLFLLFLLTTVPYYNFALQVRGYSLSIMLLSMMVYHLWNFERKCDILDALLIVFFSGLALYTIPLNLYFILSVAIFYLLVPVVGRIRKRGVKSPNPEVEKPQKSTLSGESSGTDEYFFIVILIGTGIALAVLLYYPVVGRVVQNPFVESSGLFCWETLSRKMPTALYYFISSRYLLLPAVVLGLFYLVSHRKSGMGGNEEFLLRTKFCAALTLTPFILSFVRGDRPYLRVFVNLTLPFSLFVGLCVHSLLESIPPLRSKTLWITAAMFLYCNLVFALGVMRIEKRLMRDIETGHKSQNIYYNYYQAHYHPLLLLRNFKQRYETDSVPLVVYEFDEVALPEYLRKFDIKARDRNALDEILQTEARVFVITAFPDRFRRMIARRYPGFRCTRINERLQFHNILLLTRK